ncbi:alkaline phosphatase family protein [Pseudomonas frederiksbergensis]|uniref:alkaline phosphatase D family protein n=1 Tax=Pseudomonas frederiksbergensis TaxID=104087 RepID=UPI00197F96EF|nr:alkaline phosphatase D family protein [Pseudomonas frederiksbergensis]MBN3861664.1 alkaline phosphatase family protein [Pseudomonas frederiksbergensis]
MFKPTVGPIIGHTTTNHARIFLRGELQNNALVFAGIRYRRTGEKHWSKGVFAKLSVLRDMSDVIALNDLATDTDYEYQAGWFSPMSPVHTVETIEELPLQWPRETYRFRTQSSKTTQPRAYVVGSCRYLRMTAGIASAPHLGDRIFASITSLAERAEPPISAMLMTGDQIYVDDLNIVAPDREYKDILSKYRTAFSQPHISKLMSNIPTYMILDDHEIEDNWPANKSKNDIFLYKNAMAAYELYQASHSPAHELLANGKVSRTLEQYWYQFAEGDIEWFITDSRTRRNLSANDRRILDEEQEQALLKWLINSPARVKFVVTSVMFYPDRKLHGDDAWKAFPQQRLRLLETIRAHGIKNVLFISGDVHGSLTSRLTHSEDPDFEVHTIVSSPLCNSKWLPYAKASTFILDQALARTATGEYRHELTSEVISQDNFAHLIVDAEQVRVDYHDRDGKPLQSISIKLR